MEFQEKYPIQYNREHYTVMANDVIRGKQEMTLQEARIIRLLITQVAKEDKDLKTYTCRVKDFAAFLGVTSQSLYRDVKNICEDLLKRIVRIGTGDPKQPWKSFQWVQLAEYDGNGNITLMLSEQIRPFVLALDRWFTRYRLRDILSMNSFYAIRLYELIQCVDGETGGVRDVQEYTIQYLREFFCCENKYGTTAEFNRKVIGTAVREINAKSDLWLDVLYKKTGRSITSAEFRVSVNPQRWINRENEKIANIFT